MHSPGRTHAGHFGARVDLSAPGVCGPAYWPVGADGGIFSYDAPFFGAG